MEVVNLGDRLYIWMMSQELLIILVLMGKLGKLTTYQQTD